MLLYSTVPLLYLFASAFLADGDGVCYYLDGSKNSEAKPCYALDRVGASMCCESTEDCRPDGLCMGDPNGLVGPYDNGTAFWRRSCTDFTWQDPACIALASCRVDFLSVSGRLRLTSIFAPQMCTEASD